MFGLTILEKIKSNEIKIFSGKCDSIIKEGKLSNSNYRINYRNNSNYRIIARIKLTNTLLRN